MRVFIMIFSNVYNPTDKIFSLFDKISSSWRLALMTIVVLFVIGCLTIWTMSNTPAKPIKIANTSGLTAKEIDAVQSVVSPFGSVQLFGADLQAIHTNIAKLSWVERVSVSRNWYQGVTVAVTPRKAIANFGSGRMVDANGVVFVPADKDMLMNKNMVNLEGDPEKAMQIMTQMQHINTWYAPLGLKVKELILEPRHAWIISFDNGLKVKVDRENTEQKIYMLSVELAGKFKEVLPHIEAVDLRYKNNSFAIVPKSENSKDIIMAN